MRILKPLLVGLFAIVAAVAGLFVVVAVAIAGAVIYAALRLFGKKATLRTSWQGRARAHSTTQSTAGAIDVVATEVPADRLTR
jgi:hypothetical protein